MAYKMKYFNYLIILLGISFVFSCEEYKQYPRYSLTTVSVIPDSLQIEYRTWITETVKASNQHLSAGDFEEVEDVLIYTKRAADDIFSQKVVGLKLELDDNYYKDIDINPKYMNDTERKILEYLRTSGKQYHYTTKYENN